MRVSAVSLVLLVAVCAYSMAKEVQFNTSFTAECASLSCNFLNNIWNDGAIPENGDQVFISAPSNINLLLESSNLNSISLSANFTTLTVGGSNITFTTIFLGSNSSLVLTNTTIFVQEALQVYGSNITAQEQSNLELPATATAFYLDSASHLTVTQTSSVVSHTTTSLWGSVTTAGSANLVLLGQVAIAGNTTLESTTHVEFGNVTFASSVMFPAGFDAKFVTLTANHVVTVMSSLLIESLLVLPENSSFIVSSIEGAQLFSTTAAGSIEGEGVLHLISSTTYIIPEGARTDGSWTNFNGSIVVVGHNNLTLAYYNINSNFFTTEGSSDIVLTVTGVQVNAALSFPGEIQAKRYSTETDSIPALTLNQAVTVSRCLTSVDGSLNFTSSFTCGAGYQFSVSSELLDSFRPSVSFSGVLDSLVASSAQFNNTYVSSSVGYNINGITNNGINISFVESNLSIGGATNINAGVITFAGQTNATLSNGTLINYSDSAVVSGNSVVNLYNAAQFIGVGAASFIQQPSTYVNLYGNSNFLNPGSASIEGNFGQYESSLLTLNNVEFRGTTTFASINQPVFNGQASFLGGEAAFPNGAEFSSLTINNTAMQVWETFTSGPVYIGAGASLTLKNCTFCVIINNGPTPAFSGTGQLFLLSSNVETSYDASGVYPYSNFSGPVTFGGDCVFSPVLFSFYQVNFVTGTANEPANVFLDSYGSRFYEPVTWPGPVVLNPAVENYAPLEILAPVSFTSVTSYSGSMNLASELTSLYGPVVFVEEGFTTTITAQNNSVIVAPKGLWLVGADFRVTNGTSYIRGDVDNSNGSIIFVGADAAVQISGNYSGTNGNIMYTSLPPTNASTSFNVSDIAITAGTTLWYGVEIVNANLSLQESVKNVTVFEALSIPDKNFSSVVAGLPTGLNVSLTATFAGFEGRERVYINNEYTAPTNNDTPIWKKWWFWFLIILAICLVLGIVAYFVRNRKRHQYTPLEM